MNIIRIVIRYYHPCLYCRYLRRFGFDRFFNAGCFNRWSSILMIDNASMPRVLDLSSKDLHGDFQTLRYVEYLPQLASCRSHHRLRGEKQYVVFGTSYRAFRRRLSMIHPCAAPTKPLGDIPLLSSTGLNLLWLLNHLGDPQFARARRQGESKPSHESHDNLHACGQLGHSAADARPQRCTSIRLVHKIVQNFHNCRTTGQEGTRGPS
jgi:hypothetical protein